MPDFPEGDCSKRLRGPISERDVSRITNMRRIFYFRKSFKGDISRWDVSKVANMGGMFHGATSFDGDLSKWDISTVTDMAGTFRWAILYNADISDWDVSSVQDMEYMPLSIHNIHMHNIISYLKKLICSIRQVGMIGSAGIVE